MISLQEWVKWVNKGNASIPYVLLENYKQLQLKDQEMMLLLHLSSFIEGGILFPSIDQLAERMTCSQEELTSMLNRLRKENYLHIETTSDEQGMRVEAYTLDPLWMKLGKLLMDISMQEQTSAALQSADWQEEGWDSSNNSSEVEGELFRRFELEFGRPLSPIECETISLWLDEDHYSPQLILLALKEAVVSSKFSLRYIDRILFEWQKNGIRTPEKVREYSHRFRQQQWMKDSKGKAAKPIQFSFYNWLEK